MKHGTSEAWREDFFFLQYQKADSRIKKISREYRKAYKVFHRLIIFCMLCAAVLSGQKMQYFN